MPCLSRIYPERQTISRYKKSSLETDKNKFKNSKKLRKLKEKD